MVLTDAEIVELGIVHPLLEKQGWPSFGLQPMGYDVRLGIHFKRFPVGGVVWIGAQQKMEEFQQEDPVILPPHGMVVGESVETFTMPDDVIGLGFGKTTYSRVGVFPVIPPLDPGWEGRLTLSIFNLNDRPVAVYPLRGIGQIVFFKGDEPTNTYQGRYQRSFHITMPWDQYATVRMVPYQEGLDTTAGKVPYEEDCSEVVYPDSNDPGVETGGGSD